MHLKKDNQAGYIQAAISLLIFVIMLFVPFVKIVIYDYHQQRGIHSYAMLDGCDYKEVSGIFLILFVLFLAMNVYLQSMKNRGVFSLITE